MALSFAEKQDYYLKTYRELKVKYPNYRFSAPAAPENFDFTIELNPSAKPENTDYAALHYSLERNAMKLRLEGIINVDKNKPSLTKANRVQLTTNLNTKWNSKTIYFGNKVSRMQLDLTSVQFPDDNSEAIHQLDMLLNHFIAAMEETIAELEKLENTFETAREIPVQIKRTESSAVVTAESVKTTSYQAADTGGFQGASVKEPATDKKEEQLEMKDSGQTTKQRPGLQVSEKTDADSDTTVTPEPAETNKEEKTEARESADPRIPLATIFSEKISAREQELEREKNAYQERLTANLKAKESKLELSMQAREKAVDEAIRKVNEANSRLAEKELSLEIREKELDAQAAALEEQRLVQEDRQKMLDKLQNEKISVTPLSMEALRKDIHDTSKITAQSIAETNASITENLSRLFDQISRIQSAVPTGSISSPVQNSSSNVDVEYLNSELEKANKYIQSIDLELSEAKDLAEQRRNKILELTNQLSQSNADPRTASINASNTPAEVEILTRQLAEAEAMIKRQEQQIGIYKEQSSSMEAQAQEYWEELEKLRRELDSRPVDTGYSSSYGSCMAPAKEDLLGTYIDTIKRMGAQYETLDVRGAQVVRSTISGYLVLFNAGNNILVAEDRKRIKSRNLTDIDSYNDKDYSGEYPVYMLDFIRTSEGIRVKAAMKSGNTSQYTELLTYIVKVINSL